MRKNIIISVIIFLLILSINVVVRAGEWDPSNDEQINAAAIVVRDKMTERKESFSLIIDFVCEPGKPYQVDQVGEWILEKAYSEEIAQSSDHGAYIKSSFAGQLQISWTVLGKEVVDNSKEKFLIKITYKLKYFTTKEQEELLNTNINTWINKNIDIENDTSLEKVKKIYTYITNNIEYDYTYQKYSAYNAFIEGKSVCNGYAMLIYKMFKIAGINDVHIITGVAFNGEKTERHAWNLVKIDGKYYYLDATWDATLHGGTSDKLENMTYFLKGSDFLDKNHFPEKEIDSNINISKENYFTNENIDDGKYINTTSKLKEKLVNNISVICGIKSNTSVLDFVNQNNFKLGYSVEITDAQDKPVKSNDLVKTGTIVRLVQNNEVKKEYKILIYGDTTGDGKINATDALTLIKSINGKYFLNSELKKEAGRIISSGSNGPKAVDALAIIKHVNSLFTINQSK